MYVWWCLHQFNSCINDEPGCLFGFEVFKSSRILLSKYSLMQLALLLTPCFYTTYSCCIAKYYKLTVLQTRRTTNALYQLVVPAVRFPFPEVIQNKSTPVGVQQLIEMTSPRMVRALQRCSCVCRDVLVFGKQTQQALGSFALLNESQIMVPYKPRKSFPRCWPCFFLKSVSSVQSQCHPSRINRFLKINTLGSTAILL